MAIDGKKILSEVAKAAGRSEGEMLALLNKDAGVNLPAQQPESEWGLALKAISESGKSSDPMEALTKMMMIKMMSKMAMEDEPKTDVGKVVSEALEKQAQKFDSILSEMKAQQKEDALRSELSALKQQLMNGGGQKRDELLEKFDSLNEKLEAEKEKRLMDALAAKDKDLAAFRQDTKERFDDLLDTIAERDFKNNPFDAMERTMKDMKRLRGMGRELGMSDSEISDEASKRPLKESIVKDMFKTLNRAIDKGIFGGEEDTGEWVEDEDLDQEKEKEKEEEQPQLRKEAKKKQLPSAKPEPEPPAIEEEPEAEPPIEEEPKV